MQRQPLGKGLDALLPDVAADEQEGLRELPLARITPGKHQPRERFDEEKLRQLADSMRTIGVAQPVLVRPWGDGYELIVGERRWRAAQLLGMETIPAVVRDIPDAQALELSLIENLQREDLNPIEEAMAYQHILRELRLTQEEVATRVGKDRSTVANALRLLKLPKAIQSDLATGTITMGHARAILSLPSPAAQLRARNKIVREHLSVRASEQLVARERAPAPARPVRKQNPFLAAAEERLRKTLGTQVKIRRGREGGKIEIVYYSEEDLDRILSLIRS
jgi:ParB family chromosome partitioning protein